MRRRRVRYHQRVPLFILVRFGLSALPEIAQALGDLADIEREKVAQLEKLNLNIQIFARP